MTFRELRDHKNGGYGPFFSPKVGVAYFMPDPRAAIITRRWETETIIGKALSCSELIRESFRSGAWVNFKEATVCKDYVTSELYLSYSVDISGVFNIRLRKFHSWSVSLKKFAVPFSNKLRLVFFRTAEERSIPDDCLPMNNESGITLLWTIDERLVIGI